MKKYIIVFFMFLAAGLGYAQQTFTFAQRDTLSLKMDVYQPSNPRPDHSCVVYVFGGGFISGERNNEHSRKCCQTLADKGFVAIAIDYRLFLKHAQKVPLLRMYTLFDTAIYQAVEDCSAAIAYICDHAAQWNIDTSRIILTGSSAGAITVLQTDYSRANHLPVSAALPPAFRPAAVVPYAGGLFCGNCQLSYDTPPAPTCFFHGTSDRIVHYNRFRGSLCMSLFGSNKVVKEFKKNNYPHWILRYEDRGHEIAAALPQTIDEFCAFVDATLAGRQMFYDATCVDSSIKRTKWSGLTLLELYAKH